MNLRKLAVGAVVVGLATAVACTGLDLGQLETVKKVVGSAGGTLELKGALLSIPAGALSADTEITIATLATGAPTGYTAQSALLELSPAGLTFALPVDLTLDFTGEATGLAVFLTAQDGNGWEQIAGTVSGQKITAPITHFSQAFAGTSTAANSISVDELASAAFELVCHNAVLCGEASSVAGCKALYEKFLASQTPPFDREKKGIAAGRLSFDGEAAKRCMDAVKATTTCQPLGDATAGVAECETVFTGLVALGGSCYGDNECGTGNFCSESALTCPGSCKVAKQEGETLGQGDECAKGLKRYLNTCFKPVAEGESCAPTPPAVETKPCVDDSRCDPTTKLCKSVKLAENAACVSRDQCAKGLTCVKSQAGQNGGTCQKLGNTGAACSIPLASACMLDLTCQLTDTGTWSGTCQAFSAQGGNCYGTENCEYGLYCTGMGGDAGTCVTGKAAGEACTSDPECASKWCQSGPTGKTCSALVAVGQPCDDDTRCADGADCPFVQPPPPDAGTPDGGVARVCTYSGCRAP